MRASRTCRPKRVHTRDQPPRVKAGEAFRGAFRGDIPIGFHTAALIWRLAAHSSSKESSAVPFSIQMSCSAAVASPRPYNESDLALATNQIGMQRDARKSHEPASGIKIRLKSGSNAQQNAMSPPVVCNYDGARQLHARAHTWKVSGLVPGCKSDWNRARHAAKSLEPAGVLGIRSAPAHGVVCPSERRRLPPAAALRNGLGLRAATGILQGTNCGSPLLAGHRPVVRSTLSTPAGEPAPLMRARVGPRGSGQRRSDCQTAFFAMAMLEHPSRSSHATLGYPPWNGGPAPHLIGICATRAGRAGLASTSDWNGVGEADGMEGRRR